MSRTLLFALVLVACGEPPGSTDAGALDSGADAGPDGPAAVLYDPSTDGFFDTPFPSDSRVDSRGHPDLSGFPRARGIVADGIDLVQEERPGFSPLTAVYFRFTGALDQALLPNPAETMDNLGLVTLVDVDPESPELGRRLAAFVRFQRDSSQFWPSNTLVVRPVPGLQMHPGRTYAVVVRAGVRAADGSEVERSDAFEALKAGGDPHFTQLFDALEGVGVPRADVLVASMITISDSAQDMDLIHTFIGAQEIPTVRDWATVGLTPRASNYAAVFDTYELLDGDPPYMEFGSGLIRFDADGSPAVVNRRPVQIGISVPTTPMPPGGYPIIVYGHGTGGDHGTHLRSEGGELARVGWAMIGLEAALHGDRNPDGFDVESLLVANPVAAREIVRQTVSDMLLLIRMLSAGAIVVPDAVVEGEGDVLFDASRVVYMGHSQGAQEAGVLLGTEPRLEAAFISAGGAGGLISIVDRELTPGTPIACLVASIISEPCELVTEDHPVLTQILQPMLDPADPFSFTHRYLRERPEGWAPVSIAMTEGLEDTFTSSRGIEAMAVAIGLPIVEPVAQRTLPVMLANTPSIVPPVTSNLMVGGSMVTGGLMQWADEGHFAIYDNTDARRRYVEFFRTLLESGTPTIVAPE